MASFRQMTEEDFEAFNGVEDKKAIISDDAAVILPGGERKGALVIVTEEEAEGGVYVEVYIGEDQMPWTLSDSSDRCVTAFFMKRVICNELALSWMVTFGFKPSI